MKTGKIKIILIQPPIHELSICFGIMEPYALEVLNTAILQDKTLNKQTETKIIDLRVKPIIELTSHLKNSNIDIIGITGITIDQPKIIEIAKLIKKLSPKTMIVVGGHHATMLPKDFFIPDIDLIVRGPGHKIFPDIIKRRMMNVENFSDLSGVIQNIGSGNFAESLGWVKNINEPPPSPMQNLLKNKYSCFGHRINVVVTAQGCSGRCTFCSCWPAMNGKYIVKQPEEVVEEIARAREKWIFLGDDNTFQDIKRIKKIALLIQSQSIRKFFDGYCRADIIAKNPELIELWAKIGLKSLTVGFETTSDQELKKLNKKSSIRINEEANRILQKYGIINLAHLLIDTNFINKDFKRIKEYIYKLGIVEPVFPILTPLPGTLLWKNHKEEMEFMPRQFFDLVHPLIKTNLNIEEFYNQYILLIAANYSKKRWLMSKVKCIANILSNKKKYPQTQTVTATLFSLIYAGHIIKNDFSHRKIKGFIDLLPK